MKREIILGLVALVIIGFGVLAWVPSFFSRKVVEQPIPLVKVLVAKQAIPQWSVIRDPAHMFEEREMAVSDVAQGYMSNFNDLRDRALREAIDKGKPITSSMLVDPNQLGLEGLLRPNVRSLALVIPRGNIKGSLRQPQYLVNTFVDVFYTEGNDRKSYSSIVVKNVQIRAVDVKPISPDEFAKEHPESRHTITVEVTKEQAHALVQLKDKGGSFGIIEPGGGSFGIILHGNQAEE